MKTKMDNIKRDEIKQTILDTTIKFIEENGFEAVSIRKISALVNYSPASIYQYFENKDELISAVIKYGYLKILSSIKIPNDKDLSISDRIKQIFTSYCNEAIHMNEYYKAVMLNQDDKILSITSVLINNEGNSKAIKILEDLIQEGIINGEFKNIDNKLYAKVIWTSFFGLVIRIIIEKIKDEEYIKSLIEINFLLLFDGMKN